MTDDAETQPVVSPQRIRAAKNVEECLFQARWVARSAGEWAAGAIEQIEDPHFKMLVRDSVQDWFRLDQRWNELQIMARYRLEALKNPPRITRGPA